MVRLLRVAVLCASVVLFVGLALRFNLAQAHGPGGNCTGHCQDQGGDLAPPSPSPYYQQQPYPQPASPAPSAYYGQGLRTFASLAERDCPTCRAELEQGPPAGPHNFAAAPNAFAAVPNGYDASYDRPRLSPRNMPPRQAGYPMMQGTPRGMRPYPRREFQPAAPGMPMPVDPMPAGSELGRLPRGLAEPSGSIPDRVALILHDDSPLMSGGEQLGSIDRDQTLRVLDIRGNWVQLETNWLGKNTWIRRSQVQLNDNIQPERDIAPPAT